MQSIEDAAAIAQAYRTTGYAAMPGYFSRALCAEMTAQFIVDMARGGTTARERNSLLVPGNPLELHSNGYSPLRTLHWGMTPAISTITGCALVPSYGYFRLYKRGDVLRVHSDRKACEHSLSLVLMLKDDVPWALEIATADTPASNRGVSEDFGDAAYESVPQNVGDALLYPGITRRHGRMTPNPNAGSMHLFLHWVDGEGPYQEHAFDRGGRRSAAGH